MRSARTAPDQRVHDRDPSEAFEVASGRPTAIKRRDPRRQDRAGRPTKRRRGRPWPLKLARRSLKGAPEPVSAAKPPFYDRAQRDPLTLRKLARVAEKRVGDFYGCFQRV
jgi:hypothetical protein